MTGSKYKLPKNPIQSYELYIFDFLKGNTITMLQFAAQRKAEYEGLLEAVTIDLLITVFGMLENEN
jgi:hypothetical protein